MKKNWLTLLLLLAILPVSAQFSLTSPKEAETIKNAELLVVQEKPDPKTEAKLKKKDRKKLTHYLNQIEGRNKALNEAVTNFWKFSGPVKFVSDEEADALIKKSPDKYVKMYFGSYLDYERYKTNVGIDGKAAGWSNDPKYGMTYNPSTKYTSLANEITTIEIGDPKSMIKVYLPNVYPSSADAVFGIQQMQYILNYLTSDDGHKITKIFPYIKDNGNGLKDLTLLLDKNEVQDKLTIEEIKSVYPYAVEVVDAEVIDKAILEADPKYAYVTIVDVPGGKGNVSAHVVMGASDGWIYAYLVPKVAFGIKGTNIIKYNERIKKKQLEDYSESVK